MSSTDQTDQTNQTNQTNQIDDHSCGSDSIDIPFMGQTKKRSALFWSQLVVSATAITIGTTFTAVGLMSTNVFIPILSGIVGYYLPAPKL